MSDEFDVEFNGEFKYETNFTIRLIYFKFFEFKD